MKVIGIIQARTSSKRLPNKVVRRIGNKTILDILLSRISKSRLLDGTIVATTMDKSDNIIEEVAQKYGVNVYKGLVKDVLDRFYNASKLCNADIIVRITADDPLTSISLMDMQIIQILEHGYDYVAPKKITIGLGSEVFTFNALEISWKNAKEKYEREHVTPYIYEHPEIFKIYFIKPPENLQRSDMRLTIDYLKDLRLYEVLSDTFGDLSNVSEEEVIKFMDKHPEIKKINVNVRQKSYKEAEE